MRLLAVAAACVVALAPAPSGGAAGPTRVYPLGDSITYGASFGVSVPQAGVGRTMSTPGGYRGFLDSLLTARQVAHQFVGTRVDNSSPVLDATAQQRHDGWPGWRVDQVDARLATWTATTLPDVVVVHLGTNDIGQRFDPGTTYPTADGRVNYAVAAQRALFVSHLAARLDGLVDRLQALRPGVRIVVSTAIPISSAGGTGAPHLATADYAVAVRDLVAAERAAGEKVVLADAYAAFVVTTPNGPLVVPGLLSHDNVHPMPAGFALMAHAYDAAITAALAL